MIVGTGIGGIILGLAIGVMAYYLFTRIRRRRQRSPSQNYFASQHFSSTKPYKAPSIIASAISQSSVPQRTYRHIQSSNQDSEPLTPTSPGFNRPSSYTPSLPTISDSSAFSSHTSRTARDLPLQPLRTNNNRESSAQLPIPEPSVAASSDSGSVTEQNHYPLDVKVRLETFPMPPDDSASLASSTSESYARSNLARAPTYASTSASLASSTSYARSNLARAPTYASTSASLASSTSYARSNLARAPTYASTSASTIRHPRGVYVIDENEVPDVPPEYGRHTDDTSCTPSIISSGIGRIPSSYISPGRF